MLLDGRGKNILEVHVHSEQWSFVNGGAEVCSILFLTKKSWHGVIVCQRHVRGRYVSLTAGGDMTFFYVRKMTIDSKCKYTCSFQC